MLINVFSRLIELIYTCERVQVSRDGVLETMADGYPKYTRQGGKDLFTIRFNRFSTVTSFDAIIGTSSIVDDKIRQSHESEENKSH